MGKGGGENGQENEVRGRPCSWTCWEGRPTFSRGARGRPEGHLDEGRRLVERAARLSVRSRSVPKATACHFAPPRVQSVSPGSIRSPTITPRVAHAPKATTRPQQLVRRVRRRATTELCMPSDGARRSEVELGGNRGEAGDSYLFGGLQGWWCL